MHNNQSNVFFVILALVFSVFSCYKDVEPNFSITTGDETTVDSFYKFSTIDMTFLSQETSIDWTITNYSDDIDLNNNGETDINLLYQYAESASGEFSIYLNVLIVNPAIRILSDVLTRTDRIAYPDMLTINETVIDNIDNWHYFNGLARLVRYNTDSDLTPYNLNSFPEIEEEAYFLFKFSNDGVDTSMGWLHLRQTSDNWKPQLLDIGLKQLN